MESKITSLSLLVQPKTIWAFAAALVLLAAATSFPFTERSSKAAETSGAIADQSIAAETSRLSVSDALNAQEQSIVASAAVIDEVAQKIPCSLILAKLTDAIPSGATLLDFGFDSREMRICIHVSTLLHDDNQASRCADALRKESLFANVKIANSHGMGNDRVELEMTLAPPSGPFVADVGQSSTAPRDPACSANQLTPDELTRRTERAQNDIAILENLLPTEGRVDQLVRQVMRLATTNSLQLAAIKPLPTREFSGCISQSVGLTVRGNFNGFYSFLLQLESLPRLKNVSRMEIHGSDEHNGDVQAALTLDLFCASQQKPMMHPKAE